jgi:glycosyltransferase involved in cell wall biosynthesis
MDREISIIIPAYNGEKYLTSIINTISPYYKKGYEIILVDDGSDNDDKTLDTFKSTFPNTICIKQPNKGLAAARNTGVANASGKYLQFLDIDDTISDDKIDKQYNYAIENKIDVVYSDWRMVIVNEDGNTNFEDWNISGEQNDYITSLLEGWWNPIHSYLISKEAYLNVNGSNPDLVNAQDFDLLLRMAINGAKFKYLPGKFSNYYRHMNRKSLARGSRKQYWKDTEFVIENALKILETKNNLKSQYKKAAAQRLFHVARNVYKFDKNLNKMIYNKIKSLDPDFHPGKESTKFKILYSLLGYYNTERLV